MFEAVPYSSANIFETRGIWSLGGMINEIMLVPFLCFVIRSKTEQPNVSQRAMGRRQRVLGGCQAVVGCTVRPLAVNLNQQQALSCMGPAAVEAVAVTRNPHNHRHRHRHCYNSPACLLQALN